MYYMIIPFKQRLFGTLCQWSIGLYRPYYSMHNMYTIKIVRMNHTQVMHLSYQTHMTSDDNDIHTLKCLFLTEFKSTTYCLGCIGMM